MKKLTLVAAMVLATATMSFAQSSASQTATINAYVEQGLTITVANPILNLGNLVAGTSPAAVDPTTGTVPTFTVTGDGGHAVTVTYDHTVSLAGPSSATMTFNSNFVGADALAGQSGATTPGGSVNLTNASPAAGNYYFWLGGNVGAIDPAQTPGSYTGTFHVSVAY